MEYERGEERREVEYFVKNFGRNVFCYMLKKNILCKISGLKFSCRERLIFCGQQFHKPLPRKN